MAKVLQTAGSRQTQQDDGFPGINIGLLGSLPCVTYESDESFRVTAVSPNTEELLGIRSSSLHGSSWLSNDRLPFPDWQLIQTQLAKLRDHPSVSLLHRLIGDDGALINVSHTLKGRTDGARRYFFGCLTPIPTQALDGRTIDVDTVSQFIHKIGNHFQLLNLMIDSIRRNGASAKNLDALQQSTDTATVLSRGFANLLQYSSVTSTIDLAELVQSAIESQSYFDANKEVSIEFPRSTGAGDNFTIRGDTTLLEMSIAAVIANAIEASPSGCTVRIGVFSASEGTSNMAVVRVFDCGSGISQDELLQVSRPFYTTKPGHEGMGLSIASRYVELHGGFIHLTSVKGEGTEVVIALPRVDLSGRSEGLAVPK